MANIVGQILLNQFRVDAFIASGGMGAVYRVWDLKRNVPLAMKILHSDLAEDPHMFKRFKREANALKKLTHPNIVQFYGLFQTSDIAFILERFVDGPSLKDVLRQQAGKPISVQETLTYFKAVSSALGYAHANGVVHCDVKPGNILIDRGGFIYLTDFGLARHADSITTTLAGAGTASYMAPEQIRGETTVTIATDIYALGILLFEMLTGQRPFRGKEVETEKISESANERIRFAHLHLEPIDPTTLNSTLNPKIGKVILKALEKDPNQRYNSVREFLLAVEDASNTRLGDISDRVLEKLSSNEPINNQFNNAKKEKRKIVASLPLNQFGSHVLVVLKSIILFFKQVLHGIYYVFLYLPFLGVRSLYAFLNSIFRKLYIDNSSKKIQKNSQEEKKNENIFSGHNYELFLPLNSAYDDVRREIFLGREKELNQFVQQLYLSHGGAFCLAGFRGVGKTRFLECSIDLLRSRIEDVEGNILVNVWLSLPQSYTPKELMHIIVASLINRLRELGLVNSLGHKLDSQLNLISKRLSKTIRNSVSKNFELGSSWGSFIQPSVSIGGQEEYEFLPYEAPLAQQDIISVLRVLSNVSIKRNFKKHKLRVVFVFDEMDKIDEFDALNNMLRSLKTLFNESTASFVFVLGADQFKIMLADENEGLASKIDMYIPCLWGNTENIFKSVVKGDVNRLDDATILLYQHFLNYLSFVYRGIPRRLWKMVDKHLFEENNSIFLGFSNRDIRRFKFYSSMELWLSQKIDLYVSKKPNLSDLDIDLFKMSVYALTDSVLMSQGEWFTIKNIVSTNNSNKKAIFNLSDDFISSFLNDLMKSEYLEKWEDKFRLHHRRYVELGESRDDVMLTGDFRVNSLAVEGNLAKYDHDELRTEARDINVERLNAAQAKSWALLVGAKDNQLIVRSSDQSAALIKRDTIYDKCDIGRASGNDIELSDQESSRYHARLIYSLSEWQILDMNTANGTFVDGFPISQSGLLTNGSVITIGKTTILFQEIN